MCAFPPSAQPGMHTPDLLAAFQRTSRKRNGYSIAFNKSYLPNIPDISPFTAKEPPETVDFSARALA